MSGRDLAQVYADISAEVERNARVTQQQRPQVVGPLSPRELQVVRLVGESMSNAQIAEALGISPATVKTHLANIGTKLNTGNRYVMVVHALRMGLIE